MTETVCMETLVATLRDPEVLDGSITRSIYVTSRPLGSEGATGVMQQGDLAGDPQAKVVHFDRAASAYAVTRNGNPPPPDEHVPDGDIGALLRSFVRAGSAFGPVYLTLSDTVASRGVETIRKVIPGPSIELYCQHGPDPSARGVPFTQADMQPLVGWGAVALTFALFAGSWWIYRRFIRSREPPDALPDMRPFILEQRHGVRKLHAERRQMSSDVRSALERVRS